MKKYGGSYSSTPSGAKSRPHENIVKPNQAQPQPSKTQIPISSKGTGLGMTLKSYLQPGDVYTHINVNVLKENLLKSLEVL